MSYLTDYFCINANSNFLIYGAGGDGIKLQKILDEHKCSFIGFIDKRAEEIKTLNKKPVITIDELAKVDAHKDSIILISIKNVYEHSNIANSLAKMGFTKNIFIPKTTLDDNIHNEDDAKLADEYHKILNGSLRFNTKLPKSKTDIQIDITDKFFISKDDDYIVSYLPTQLLFNYKDHGALQDVNMLAFYPITELYASFENMSNTNYLQSFENYVTYCLDWLKTKDLKLTQQMKQNFINSRFDIYQQMKDKVQFDPNYFVRNAPLVTRTSYSHFNLVASGRNRIAFLVSQGFEYVPVKMQKTEYDLWSQDLVSELLDVMNTCNLNSLFAKTPNPYCMNISARYYDYTNKYIKLIATILYKNIQNKSMTSHRDEYEVIDNEKYNDLRCRHKIVTMMSDEDNSYRFFLNCGFNVSRCDDMTNSDCISQAINKLFYYSSDTIQYYNFNETINTLLIDDTHSEKNNSKLIDLLPEQIFLLKYNNDSKFKYIEDKGYILKDTIFTTIEEGKIIQGFYFEIDNEI